MRSPTFGPDLFMPTSSPATWLFDGALLMDGCLVKCEWIEWVGDRLALLRMGSWDELERCSGAQGMLLAWLGLLSDAASS